MTSLQDIIKQRQRSNFVGREEQLDLFRRNLELPIEDSRRRFIFNICGPGGVGKSTLLRQLCQIAAAKKIVTAYTDEAGSIPEVMGRFAEQLAEKGYPLRNFSERYQIYHQRICQLAADPHTPPNFSMFAGKSLVKTGIKLGRYIPGGGVAFEFVDEDAVATQVGEWATYVAKKLSNKSEVLLVQEPLDVLTPLFLQEIGRVAEKTNVALFFDTDGTDEGLDRWLREVLEGRYGEVSSHILFAIAGQQGLDENLWADYEGLIARLPLEPFTEEEAQLYLARKGITNERVIQVILSLSGRLPLWVATLAAESPQEPARVGEREGTAVERFLQWVDDPKRRQMFLDAALPSYLNREIWALLNGGEGGGQGFYWLKEMPFVEERARGWVYHDVVRSQMLRYRRQTSPQRWADLQGKLGDYYEQLRNPADGKEAQGWRSAWQNETLEALYHRLCQAPQQHLAIALNQFLAALKEQRCLARSWAETIKRAGKDAEMAEVQRWGKRLLEGLNAYDQNRYKVTVTMFTELLKCADVEKSGQAVALGWRGKMYRLMKHYAEAFKDLNRAIELNPEYEWAIANRGITYAQIERYTEALKDLNRAIELNPNYEWAIASRGETYRLMKRYEEALEDFDRAIELDPNDDLAIAERGWTYQLMERYEEALKDFDRAIELDPNDDLAIAERGWTYRLMERYEEALEDLNRAIELDPNDDLAIALRGVTYRSMERYDEALEDLNRAIELNPNHAWAIALRGETYHIMKRYTEALKDLNRAIELSPQDARAFASRGETCRLMERYEEAIHDLDRAIELDPHYTWAIALRGETYHIMKRYTEALKDLNRAIELDPQYTLAIAHRGQTYRAMGQYPEALKDFNKAIELNPNYDWAISNRGETYLLLQRYGKAIADFNRALEFDPENDWRLYNRALAYQALKQPDNARNNLIDALRLAQQTYDQDPEQWNNTLNLALYCLAAGNNQQAKHFYHDAIDRGVPWQRIQNAIRDLDNFLRVFPQHSSAKAAQQALQKRFSRAGKFPKYR